MIALSLFEKKEAPPTKSIIQGIIDTTRGIITPSKTPLVLVKHPQEEALDEKEKRAVLKTANMYIINKELNQPQFVSMFGKPIKEVKFEDLLFVIGYKHEIGQIVFKLDTLNRPLCYNLLVSKVGDYIKARRDTNTPIIRMNVDPWSVLQVPVPQVKMMHHEHALYQEFMDLLGNQAKR